jgi:hypothetical protein
MTIHPGTGQGTLRRLVAGVRHEAQRPTHAPAAPRLERGPPPRSGKDC